MSLADMVLDILTSEGLAASGDAEAKIKAILDLAEAELEARRLVMAEQDRIAAMPRSYSYGGGDTCNQSAHLIRLSHGWTK